MSDLSLPSQTSPLYVDSAAGSKEYAPLIAQHFINARLPVSSVVLENTASSRFLKGGGDFVFGGNGPDGPVMCGIELKKLGDYVTSTFGSSPEGSRLDTFQIPNMQERYQYVYLIIEGAFLPVDSRQGPGSPHILGSLSEYRPVYSAGETLYRRAPFSMGMHGGAPRTLAFLRMLGKLHSMMIGQDVRFLWAFDAQATASLVFQVWSFWQKPWMDHEFHVQGRRFKGSGKTPKAGLSASRHARGRQEVYTYLTACVSGIGAIKATVVAGNVPNMDELVRLDVAGLRKAGLGEKDAMKVWSSLRGR